jgi:hypothetical protein
MAQTDLHKTIIRKLRDYLKDGENTSTNKRASVKSSKRSQSLMTDKEAATSSIISRADG